jgi:hypothetical protein
MQCANGGTNTRRRIAHEDKGEASTGNLLGLGWAP